MQHCFQQLQKRELKRGHSCLRDVISYLLPKMYLLPLLLPFLRLFQKQHIRRQLSWTLTLIHHTTQGDKLPTATSPLPVELAKKVRLGIAMELCPMGSLFKSIDDARTCQLQYGGSALQPDANTRRPPGWAMYSNWRLRMEVAKGSAAGLEYMHAMGVVHCDLTSYNILLSDTRCVSEG